MANAYRRLNCIGEVLPPEPECNVYQADKNRHFNKGTDNRSKSLPGVNTEYGDRNGYGEFEIV